MSQVQHANTPGNTAERAEFRRLMGLFTTGVCVVSVARPGGAIAAMTVNSFVSVSLDPMLVCWSLQNGSSQFDTYAGADRFAVSILSEGQGDLARRYAARGDSQLRHDDFEWSADGLPVIRSALGHIECSRWSQYPAGDHVMILGEVTGLAPAHGFDAVPAPLGFFNGQFCSIDLK